MDVLKFLHENEIYVVLSLIFVGGLLGLYFHSVFVSLKFTLPFALFLMLLKPMVYMDVKKAFTNVTETKVKYLALVTLFYIFLFPLLTYGLMKLIVALFPALDNRIVAAIVILGLSPIASSAPAFVGMAKGRVQLALVGVIWTFLLSVFVVPFYGHALLNSVIHVPTQLLLNSILWYVIVPLAVGQTIKYLTLWWKGEDGLNALKRPLSYLSLLGLYWMVLEVFGINSKALLSIPGQMLGVLVLMYIYHIVRFATAYYAGKFFRMPMDRIVSLVYSASVNMTMSTAISIATFGTIAGVGTILGGPLSEMVLMVLMVGLLAKKVDVV